MANILIIYAHPSHEGAHAYFLEQIKNNLDKNNNPYELLDLYALNYDPVLHNSELYTAGRRQMGEDTARYQAQIQAAKSLLFIYPTWWQNMPAILKGFIDRTFVSGFAYKYKGSIPVGLLKGRRAAAFTATGQPRWFNFLIKRDRSLRVLLKDALAFGGLKTRGFSIGSVRKLDESTKQAINKKAQQVVRYLLK